MSFGLTNMIDRSSDVAEGWYEPLIWRPPKHKTTRGAYWAYLRVYFLTYTAPTIVRIYIISAIAGSVL